MIAKPPKWSYVWRLVCAWEAEDSQPKWQTGGIVVSSYTYVSKIAPRGVYLIDICGEVC